MVFSPHRRTLAGICLVCTVLTLTLHFFVWPYSSLELGARDWLMSNPAARLSRQNPDLLYLGIDKASTELSAPWEEDYAQSPTLRLMKAGFPWNRAVYAAVAERVLESGAKTVVFDLVFPAPRAGDSSFKAALDRYADRVVIGSNFVSRSEKIAEDSAQKQHKPELVPPTASLIPRENPAETRVGFVNVIPDPDGKIRRIHFLTTQLEYSGKDRQAGVPDEYSLAARALQKAGYAHTIPKSRERVMIRFSEPILSRPLYEIFVETQWAAPPYRRGALFKDKIVIVGDSGNAAEDRLQTPYGTSYGPLIHLSAINAALNGDFLRETTAIENALLIIAAGLLAWGISQRIQRPFIRLVVLALAVASAYTFFQLAYNWFGFTAPLLSPLVALGSSGLTWSVWEQVLDLREKAKLRRTFERYVSRDVVRELLDNPESYLNTLGGMRKNVTVLFSDVRGFTTLTEAAEDPHRLVQQLNEYFNEMVNIVFENKGTLDKFIGDAVMAHWGSIVTEGEEADARHAVATAVQMRKTLARLNPGWKERGMLELSFGIGVNYGEAIVGNLGCEAKMEVSMIGDAVNLASRLEGVTKTYHIDLCIGEGVATLVRDAFIVRSLDLIVVKGKTKPVAIFTVLDERSAMTEPTWLHLHEEAMQCYRRGDFAAASTAWRAVLAQAPDDSISEIFLQRCDALLAAPPAGKWTGVFEMTSK